MIKEFFKLEKRNTNIRTEFIAGLTTFLAMAYILVVNPTILSSTEMDPAKVFTATAIAAIVGTLLMALLANYPVALAPGMGMNAFFAYSIVSESGYGFTWQLGLLCIFFSGLLFIFLSASGIREKVINAIPQDLKYAVGAGIGLFIAYIGLKNSGIIAFDTPSGVIDGNAVVFDVIPKIGDLSNPLVLLAIIGLIITVFLYVFRIPAAIFFGMIITTIIGIVWNLIDKVSGLPTVPSNFVDVPKAPHFGEFVYGFNDLNGISIATLLIVIFSLLFIDFFDTAGTLVSVGSRCGLINEEGKLEGSGKALLADASATVVGAVAGTTSTTSYIESLAGVEVGGRTGLTGVFTALFFLIAVFFYPVFSIFTTAVTAPALIFVGILMATQLGKIAWENMAIAIPAFLTIIAMPLTYSIATGIAVGFLFYPISMLSARRHKEVSITMYILSGIFLLYFILTNIGL